MNFKQKHFRLPSDLFNAIQTDAQQQGLTENEYGIKALNHYLNCKKATGKGPSLVRSPITTNCSDPQCNRQIPFGQWCYYHPKMGALCLECGTKRGYTTQQRVRKIIQQLELDEDVKSLKWKKRELADQILEQEKQLNLYNLAGKYEDLQQLKRTLLELGDKYLRETIGSGKEKETIEKIEATIRKIEEKEKEITDFINKGLFSRLKPKRKPKEVIA